MTFTQVDLLSNSIPVGISGGWGVSTINRGNPGGFTGLGTIRSPRLGTQTRRDVYGSSLSSIYMLSPSKIALLALGMMIRWAFYCDFLVQEGPVLF
jgi:hypothetical protein